VLFLSRDRFGIKPLYYARDGAGLHFASEIKALLRSPTLRREPDEETVRRFLITGSVDQTERTFFEGVRSLPPAHNLTLGLARTPDPAPRRYWAPPAESYSGSRSQAAEEFADLLRDSVRLHARSDVPVGTCLSGGLDSSSIVCLAEQLRERNEIPRYAHSGFGYVPDDPAFSERGHMQAVAAQTGLRMTYVEVSAERFVSRLPEVARQQDEPFGSTSIAAQWFVFESAREAGMKVMLDGQGADEVLAGYHSYIPLAGRALLRSRRPLRYARFARAHRDRYGKPPMTGRAALAAFAGGRRAGPVPATPPEASIMTPELRGRVGPPDFTSPEYDSLHDLLAAHTGSQGLPSLLRFEDRNSMAHSIEARVPFLDHRLVEFCFRLPGDYKLDGVETKAVLRDAMRGVLPESILERKDKIGFRAQPTAVWNLARERRDSLLEQRTEYERRWLDPTAVSALIDGRDRSVGAEFQLWRVVNLKLWLRAFWDEGREADA
jgi:asparagine synthase (glutamine-hydrolysing)